MVKIVIIGGGPTGLGAALRLTDLGVTDWELYDCSPQIGGLSRSFVDDAGFTWDIGGHVIFSHYSYFDDAMNFAISEWFEHQRESWVRTHGVWVPYPFQNNIHRLPEVQRVAALEGLLDVYKETYSSKPANFEEYFSRQFGKGICDIFMRPYNFKVWAVPPALMSCEWVGERVATVDVKRVCRNLITGQDDLGWGPNATFRFPARGGTGAIWASLAARLPASNIHTGSQYEISSVNLESKTIALANGSTVAFDCLISTMPFDDLLRRCHGAMVDQARWTGVADQMVFSGTHVIGIGIRGAPPAHLKSMCWMYFPDSNSPFYRATVFSNYSKFNAPEGCWSLMLEVSESVHKPVASHADLVEACIAGCLASALLTPTDEIVSRWHKYLAKGYPTPFVGRNTLLDEIQPLLMKHGVMSRGRFGGWKYEVANQDHSMMQGVEAVDFALHGTPERTYFHPNEVNATKNTSLRLSLTR